MTTVGYGDLSPKTDLGQAIAACLMIMGYGILAVPTGIVSVELAAATRTQQWTTQACPSCSKSGHDADAKHCKYCGAQL
jgi:voltage-gated potassium channel